MDGLFHDCGALLEHEEIEDDLGDTLLAYYCSECEEYTDAELEEGEWRLSEEQEQKGVVEVLDGNENIETISYVFDGCGHEEALRHEYPARHGDEDNLIMYECVNCGNTERANQDW